MGSFSSERSKISPISAIVRKYNVRDVTSTTPKVRFLDVVVTKAHDLSYTCLVEDREEFKKNK